MFGYIYFQNSNSENVFSSSSDSRYAAVWRNVADGPGGLVQFSEWSNILLTEDNSFVVTNRIAASLVELVNGYPIYIGQQSFNNLDLGLVVRKGLKKQNKQRLRGMLQHMIEGGMYDRILHQYDVRYSRINKISKFKHKVKPLNLEPLVTLLYICFVIFLFSLLVLLLEISCKNVIKLKKMSEQIIEDIIHVH